VTPE